MHTFVNSTCLLHFINPPEYSDTLHGIECARRPRVDIQPMACSCHENTFKAISWLPQLFMHAHQATACKHCLTHLMHARIRLVEFHAPDRRAGPHYTPEQPALKKKLKSTNTE